MPSERICTYQKQGGTEHENDYTLQHHRQTEKAAGRGHQRGAGNDRYMRAINKVGRCTLNTAHKSLPTQKNTKLYGRHRLPYNLVFIWCFNLQNGQLRKVTIHIFESHKSPQCSTFLDFRLPYGGDKLLLDEEDIKTIFSDFEITSILEDQMNRYSKPKFVFACLLRNR